MDRVRAASETAESFRARLARGTGRGGKSSKELVARLALQLHLIGEGIADVYEAAPIEAVLSVEPALDGGGDRHGGQDEWCEQLLAMYRAWAAARNMQLSEVSPKAKELPLLLVGGFGAYRTLSHEAGLHVLEMPGEEKTVDRVTARIRLAAAPLGEIPPNKLPAALAAALSRAAPSNTLVRRYRNGSSPLVRDMVGLAHGPARRRASWRFRPDRRCVEPTYINRRSVFSAKPVGHPCEGLQPVKIGFVL